MTHWGYWKIKKRYVPKELCSYRKFIPIDSFEMFNNKQLVDLVRQSKDRTSFIIPQYDLIAVLQDNNSLSVTYKDGIYTIPVEVKKPNFGGKYYFFHCPKCIKRMRKLYCVNGFYQCRKCANLGYYSQRLRLSERNLYGEVKIKEKLKKQGGSLEIKPSRVHKTTLQRHRIDYVQYDKKYYDATISELIQWYGEKRVAPLVEETYWPPSGLLNAYYY